MTSRKKKKELQRARASEYENTNSENTYILSITN